MTHDTNKSSHDSETIKSFSFNNRSNNRGKQVHGYAENVQKAKGFYPSQPVWTTSANMCQYYFSFFLQAH